jgi:hypothetical protein
MRVKLEMDPWGLIPLRVEKRLDLKLEDGLSWNLHSTNQRRQLGIVYGIILQGIIPLKPSMDN